MNDKNICVGDVFQRRLNGEPSGLLVTDVIIKIDSPESFHAVSVLSECSSETLHPWGGSFQSKEIERVIGHWEADRIINALREGMKFTGLQLWSEELFTKLQTEMEQQSHKEKI